MIKKLLKFIGSFVVVLIILLVILFSWMEVTATDYDQEALPVLQKALPTLTTWDIDQILPLLNEAALAEFETERGRYVLSKVSALGAPISLEQPEFRKSMKSPDIHAVIYTVAGEFEHGFAVLTVTLVEEKDTYKIQSFHAGSESFLK